MAYSNCAAQYQNIWNVIKHLYISKQLMPKKTTVIYTYKLLSGFIYM